MKIYGYITKKIKNITVISIISLLGACAAPPTDGLDTYSANNAVTANVSLSWQPPEQNADGSALSNLAGYKIYYGTQSVSYSNAINIDNPGIVDHVIEGLTPDEYYLTVTAYNADGIESNYATEVIISVEPTGKVTVL